MNVPILTRFYHDCILPELADPRYTRHMPIRDPEYIVEAKLELRQKQQKQKAMKEDNSDIPKKNKLASNRKKDSFPKRELPLFVTIDSSRRSYLQA